jgi:hypothetical protein
MLKYARPFIKIFESQALLCAPRWASSKAAAPAANAVLSTDGYDAYSLPRRSGPAENFLQGIQSQERA